MRWSPTEQADLTPALRVAENPPVGEHATMHPRSTQLPGALVLELWQKADAESCGFTLAAFAEMLLVVGTRHNFGEASAVEPKPMQIAAFFHGLQLADLVLAQACAAGNETAWQRFIEKFGSSLKQAAVAITRSSALGEELAESLYSELFGLTERDGARRSPLASYSGRGSLMGWLRTTLAQRHVDHHRRTHREVPLDDHDAAARDAAAEQPPAELAQLSTALSNTLRTLDAEERFLLSSYFLDGRTLLEISRLLRVHEATVSRKLKRLTDDVRKRLLRQLQHLGLSRAASEELLGADPRDISLNVRNLLQASSTSAFLEQAAKKGGHP